MELVVSEFMINTSRVCPQPNINRFRALLFHTYAANQPVDDGDYTRIVTSSGSSSEFYIEPLLSCIDDIAIMYHRNDQLAIPEGHPVPRCLPAEFHREVEVFELVETEYTCYVLARRVCKLIKCTTSDNYIRVSAEPCVYTSITTGASHGPAEIHEAISPASRCFNADESGSSWRSLDVVSCIRCLVWPPQAAEWTTRRREHNWPDSATINCVVHNGCNVVHVAHPWCRENEVMNRRQWRLSFSRVETILLNTWSPTQQLVYHMLRVFASCIQSYHGLSAIKRYHIKTLLLWMFEVYPQLWNTNCVINMCTQMLHVLAKWLMSAELPMYFVTQCNLFDAIHYNASEIESFLYVLNNVTDEYLCRWFFDIYIRLSGPYL